MQAWPLLLRVHLRMTIVRKYFINVCKASCVAQVHHQQSIADDESWHPGWKRFNVHIRQCPGTKKAVTARHATDADIQFSAVATR